ncbi:glycosyltransferase [Streptomyces oryzae]|uniref:Glycosyltransferase n=1 Tax=Streptomyces oryzae TaxID=1434886 RepID=A0ABS3XL29_9ACTN|nr:glycosyltransferase [Streptomyces oryzae]MBO8196069.1 glycosyltransferase [Streptomyces oryzae]
MHTATPSASEESVKVSIVVPTYNTGKTVLTGLRSFLAQTMPRSPPVPAR